MRSLRHLGSEIGFETTAEEIGVGCERSGGFPVSHKFRIDAEPGCCGDGQTYDRQSISLWIESGHNTCPKTGQTLAHTNLVTNTALKNLIALWCREQRIPFDYAASSEKLTEL